MCINIQNTRIDAFCSMKNNSSWLWTKYLVSSVLIFWFYSIVKETNKLAWQRPEPLGISKVEVKVAQSCSTFCHPTDCSPPGSSVHRILQPRILPNPGIKPRSPQLQSDSLASEPPGKPRYKQGGNYLAKSHLGKTALTSFSMSTSISGLYVLWAPAGFQLLHSIFPKEHKL